MPLPLLARHLMNTLISTSLKMAGDKLAEWSLVLIPGIDGTT